MLEARVERLENRTDQLESQFDRLLQVSIENQEDLKEMKSDISTIKENQERTLQAIDSLVSVVKRHDDEIGALKAATHRITDKL